MKALDEVSKLTTEYPEWMSMLGYGSAGRASGGYDRDQDSDSGCGLGTQKCACATQRSAELQGARRP